MADESHDCSEIANVPGSSACKRKREEETRHLIRESRSRSNLMAEESNVPGSSACNSSSSDRRIINVTVGSISDRSIVNINTGIQHDVITGVGRDVITGVWRDVVTGNTIEGPRYVVLNSTDGYESKVIRDNFTDLDQQISTSMEGLVGMDYRLNEMLSYLDIGCPDFRIIGICGMGGIGKTTIAQVVFERLQTQFEGYSFLENVKEVFEKQGAVHLQKQLLSNLLKCDENVQNTKMGKNIMRRRLRTKRVLIVLDDVDQDEQLEALCDREWFCSGSRIIITSRDEHLLNRFEVDEVYKVKPLTDAEALQLFKLKALKKDQLVGEEVLKLSKKFLKYANGLPLAIKVLGSSVKGRSVELWSSALDRLKEYPEKKIINVLKVSFDGLESREQKIFLDIACFFKGENIDRVRRILQGSDAHCPDFDLQVLLDKSMLTLLGSKLLWMHDMIQELGWEVVRRESLDEPGKRSRLWLPKDINYVLSKNTGTESIEGIFMNSTMSKVEVDVNAKSFSVMSKLRYLKINCGNLPSGLECLPNSLQILEWTGYPSKSLPQHFNPEKLLELRLCHSCFEHFPPRMKNLYNLKIIDLSHSVNLLSTPNLKFVPYLEVLILEGCTRLYKIDPSIRMLKRLVVLNLKDCKHLVSLPSSVCGLKSLKELDLSGCSKLDKLSDELVHVNCLEKLDVSGTGIRELPSSISLLKNLKKLSLSGCKGHSHKSWNMILNPFQLFTSSVPKGLSLPCLSGLQLLTELDLSDCNLSEEALPSDFCCLSSLRELNLSSNQFVGLPRSICQLSKLTLLTLDGCRNLQTLPELPSSLEGLDVNNCISLSNPIEQCNSAPLGASCCNCFKMVENKSYKSIALSLLARYLQEPYGGIDRFEFVAPGNEIPKWYNHQSERCSITVEVRPGWLSNKWMGFALCAVFRLPKPLEPLDYVEIFCTLRANGREIRGGGGIPTLPLGGKWGQPVLDHIWSMYLPGFEYFDNNWQDIYYQLEFSFEADEFVDDGIVEVNKCGFRMIYEEDVEELRQTLGKQSNAHINTKRDLQYYDDASVGQEEEEEPHTKIFKQLDLDGAGPMWKRLH